MTNAKNTTHLPTIFTHDDISFIEIDGEIAMTAIELGRHLGYKEPKISISNLYNRYKDELAEFTGVINLMTPSGAQDHRIFYEEGIYIVCMLAQTERAKEFRRRVAKLIKALRQRRMAEIVLDAKRDAVLSVLGLQKKIQKLNKDPIEYLEDHIALREAGFSMKKSARFLRMWDGEFRTIDKALRPLGFRFLKKDGGKEGLPC